MTEEKICQFEQMNDFLITVYKMQLSAKKNNIIKEGGFYTHNFFKCIDCEVFLEAYARCLFDARERGSKL